MIQAKYSSWTGRKLEIRSAYANQITVEFKGWRDSAQWQIEHTNYTLSRAKGKGYPLVMSVNGQEIMRVARVSMWKTTLEGHYANQPLRFERPSIWKSGYQVYLNGVIIGEVKAEGFWQRTMTASFNSQQPYDFQLGCLMIAISIWRQEAASAAAS